MAKEPKPTNQYSTGWMADAACGGLDTNSFYKKTSDGKKLCRGCPVKPDCLDYALMTEQYGIWGGLSQNQRNRKYPIHIRNAMREDHEL